MSLKTMNLGKIGNNTLLVLGVLTALSGIGTFFGTLEPLLTEWDIAHYTVLFGVIKLLIAGLLIWQKTRVIGALFAASYFGGGIAAHVVFESFNAQFIVLIILSVALYVGTLARVYQDG
ncbi:MAG: hypothetical protein ACOC4I_02660 [Spirochaetota bacterium]